MPSLHLSSKNNFCFFAKTAEKSLTIFKKFDIIFRQSNERAVAITYMRTWRNWQTHKTKDLMRLFSCRFKSCCPHQTGIIRTLSNQGSYFSLQGITSVFKSPADKRIARSFYTRSYGLFSFIWLYTKPDFFAFRGG